MIAALQKYLSFGQAGRYLLISGAALLLDLGVFFVMISMGGAAVPASVAGYLAGTQLHWLLSTRLVFADGVAASTDTRRRQQLQFFASALLGISCNVTIVHFGSQMGLPLMLAKLIAVGASFILVLALRATIIFARPAR